MMDDEGMVYIMGRYKDLIICGEENISAAAVEACLGNLKGVTVRFLRSFHLHQIRLGSSLTNGGISTTHIFLECLYHKNPANGSTEYTQSTIF